MEADERTVKAAIYGLNRAGGRTRELEEAWIIHALVREDGMSQVEVAELLGRHKSWVCRRLALIERLGAKARDDLRVGLLSPTAARQIVRLPQGNQAEVLDAARREALSGAELTGVVDLWLGCSERNQQQYILAHPREALSQAKGAKLGTMSGSGWDCCSMCWAVWKCGWRIAAAPDSPQRIARSWHPVLKSCRVTPPRWRR
jgi:hypothetical protein